MVLARPVRLPNDPMRYLLQRDREIPSAVVPKLREWGIREVWVRNRDLEFLEDIIDEELDERQREIYVRVRHSFEQFLQSSEPGVDVTDFQSSISGLFSFLRNHSGSTILLQKLDAFDNYLMSHSANVCYLSLLLGVKLERYLIDQRGTKRARDAKNIESLGLGCLLHDLGKMQTPPKILNKPGRLTAEEMGVMRLHTVAGYEMVKDNIPAAAAQILLNHHQRYDGRGYPARTDVVTGEPLPSIRGTRIPIFCRIATICDVYDAATSKRVYSDAKPPIQVLTEMRTWSSGMFDPEIEKAFFQIIPPFPIGQVVTLSDGVEAAVVDFNPKYPLQPKVQGLRDPAGRPFQHPSLEEIDLAMFTDVQIVEVDGTDVRPFVAGQEPYLQTVG